VVENYITIINVNESDEQNTKAILSEEMRAI
jgi:hypothetical protein